MADFCYQCSMDLFGEDFEELAAIAPPPNGAADPMLARVLCEGCGPTLVDHAGHCVGGCSNPAHGVPP